MNVRRWQSVALGLLRLIVITGVLAVDSAARGEHEGAIAGLVTAKSRAIPLASVTILIQGTGLGTTSNERGEFQIGPVPPGTWVVIARRLGYAEWQSTNVTVRPDSLTTLVILLEEAAIPLGEIQVTAERRRLTEDIRSSVVTLAPARARTLAGVAEDVMRTLQALPGISSPSDFSSQLVIRGSGPDENLVVLDDIEIFNPYRLYGLISMFNPETVTDITLITGGFPARYGDRLSSVLDVRSRDGDRTGPVRGNIDASISNANLVLSGAMPFRLDGSYLMSGRRTYYDLILGPIARNSGLVSGDVAFPNFTDFQSRLVIEPAKGHRLSASALFSHDGVDLMSGRDRQMPDSVNVVDNTRNNVAGVAWQYIPRDGLLSKLTLSWYDNRGITQFDGDFLDPSLDRTLYENGDTSGIRLFNVGFNSEYEFRKLSVGEDLTVLLPSHTVEAGAGVDALRSSLIWHFRPDATFRAILQLREVALADDFVQSRSYRRAHVYVQDNIAVTESFSVQPGIRLDEFQILGRSYVQPRLNIAYRLDPITTLRAAWGIYRQSPGYEKLLDQATFYDFSGASLSGLNAEQSVHWIAGVDRWISEEWRLRVEGYTKNFSDVIVQEIVPGTIFQTAPIPGGNIRLRSGWSSPVATTGDSVTTVPINGATGRSYGIEVMLEKPRSRPEDRISGWIGYSLSHADRERGGIVTPFRFDQRHTLDVVMDYRLSSSFTLGARWRYASNFPYTEPVGLKPRIVDANQNGRPVKVIQVDGNGNVIFDVDLGGESNRYSGRLPAYHRLDLRITAFADYWGFDWAFYVDVINVYNRSNVLNYRNFVRDDLTLGRNAITMLPIFPTLGFSVHF